MAVSLCGVTTIGLVVQCLSLVKRPGRKILWRVPQSNIFMETDGQRSRHNAPMPTAVEVDHYACKTSQREGEEVGDPFRRGLVLNPP